MLPIAIRRHDTFRRSRTSRDMNELFEIALYIKTMCLLVLFWFLNCSSILKDLVTADLLIRSLGAVSALPRQRSRWTKSAGDQANWVTQTRQTP